MPEQKAIQVAGTLRVGDGKEQPLFCITPICPYGVRDKLDILLSADGRHVWVQLDADSARRFAAKINQALDGDKNGS